MHQKQLFLTLLVLFVFLATPLMADQNVALQNGFNFIAVTVNTVTNSEALLTANTNISQIFLFDSTTQEFKFHMRLTTGALFGESFNFVPGAGYVIKTTGVGNFTLVGNEVATTAKTMLAQKFNFVGFPTVTSSPLVSALLAAHTDVKSIFRWDYSLQGFKFYMRLDNGGFFGEDFTMQPNVGYFVDATAGNSELDFGNAVVTGTSSIAGTVQGITAAPGINTAATGVYSLKKN
jgi:hypothetical protein